MFSLQYFIGIIMHRDIRKGVYGVCGVWCVGWTDHVFGHGEGRDRKDGDASVLGA